MDDKIKSLAQQIQMLDQTLRAEMKQKFDRDLPFDELLFDRWERARHLGFGAGSSIYHNSYVFGDVQVGEHTWIGPFTILEGSGGITIGDYCSISSGVQIYTHDSVLWALSGGKAPYPKAPVVIGDCTYLGSQTVVARGVTIGDHVVIGACSFVNRDIPPFSVAVGVPCQVIGEVVIEGDDIRLVYHK